MIISNKFLNAAESKVQERVIQKIFQELSRIFPKKYNSIKESEVLKALAEQRKGIRQKNIITEKGLFTWLAFTDLLGPSFFERPEWVNYWTAAGKTGDYAIGSFADAVNMLFGIAGPDDTGFGLSEPALEMLPAVATVAMEWIIEQGTITALAEIEGGRQYFLETAPSAITKNPFNAKVASLNTQLRKNREVILKTGKALQDMKTSMLTLEIENIALNTALENGALVNDQDPAEQLKKNEQLLDDLRIKVASEQEKNSPQLRKLTENNKALLREIQQLKHQQRV